MKSAATLDLPRASIVLRGTTLAFDVTIANSGTGHNVPTGFAFARQMWLEVKVSDGSGAFFSSGVVANSASDLCDSATLDEPNNPLLPYVKGCDKSDPALVNFQRKLVNRFDIARDKVPTMETLEALVDRLASWKINQVQLYIEHTFAYRGHEEVWATASPLTPDEVVHLDEFCRARHFLSRPFASGRARPGSASSRRRIRRPMRMPMRSASCARSRRSVSAE